MSECAERVIGSRQGRAVALAAADLPAGPEDITTAWLTAALGRGVTGAAGISEVSLRPVGDGRGYLGSSFRAVLSYHDRPGGAPDSVVVKLPAPTAEPRDVANRGRLYEREFRFFVELAPGTKVGVPRCFAAGYDPRSDRFALVLEDVAGRRHADQLAGCPLDLAEHSLRQLARIHAAWWRSDVLSGLSWVTTFSEPRRVDNLSQLLRTGWPVLCELLAGRDGLRPVATGEAVLDFLPEAMARLDRLPQTLLHGDPRLDNVMFDAGADRTPVVLLDWQNVSRGAAVSDVCYFLVQNLSVADFRAHRSDLLAAYHQELVANGVTDVDVSDLATTLVLALPVCFAVAASLFVVGDQHHRRTRELGMVMAERALVAAREIGVRP